MTKSITLKFTSSGIQSDIYYLTAETFSKLQDKDIGNISPLEYIEQFADKEFNLSFGICLDNPNFKAKIIENQKEIELGLQNISYFSDGDAKLNNQLLTYDVEDFRYKDCEGPNSNHVAAIFAPISYPFGSIECTFDVKENFKPSDILIKFKSLDLPEGFLHENIYCQDLNISEGAEYEISGIIYDGIEHVFGQDLSFSGGAGSPLLFTYDEDEEIWFGDYFTEIFEEN